MQPSFKREWRARLTFAAANASLIEAQDPVPIAGGGGSVDGVRSRPG
ncbi:hypothetical protein ACWCO0_25775 [Streptomyces tubercidicus]